MKGERIKTLDGVDRALDPDMLVIADADKAQAVAGVMGGGLSEVSTATKTIVLESAFFDPKSVRRTSKKLGLKTEASARFERGADVNAAAQGHRARDRAPRGNWRGRGARRRDRSNIPRPPRRERSSCGARASSRCSDSKSPMPTSSASSRGSGSRFARRNSGWDVAAPTFRVDVLREVDLIEEVGRHYGYDRLPSTFPPLTTPPAPSDPRIERDRLVRSVLLAAGCSEALTFSFIDAALAAHFADAQTIVPIDNPLSAQFSVLRPSLLPGLLTSVAHNRHRERADVRLFELGAAMTRAGESPARRPGADRRTAPIGAPRTAPSTSSTRKGIVEAVADALQVEVAFDGATRALVSRPRPGGVVSVGGRAIGSVGMLAPAVIASAGLSASDDVYVAELDLDALTASRSTAPLTATPLPRYPSIARDISIVVDDTLPAETVRGTIRSAAPDTLVSVREFDRYQGKGVPEGRVSLSLRLTFRSPERTLTDAEVETAMKEILPR